MRLDGGTENIVFSKPISGTTGSFSGLVTGIAPTSDLNFATKKYVDDNLIPAQSLSEVLAVGNTSGANNIIIADDQRVGFGTDSDLKITHSGTAGTISNDTGTFTITNTAIDADINFYATVTDGAGGGTEELYFQLDGSIQKNEFYKPAYFKDNIKAQFGTDSDLEIYHDGTDGYIDNINGELIIQNNSNDKKIIFKSDNGIGDITEYFRIDGNINRNVITVTTQLNDNVPLIFGSGAGSPSIKYDSTATQLFISGESKFLNDLYVVGDIIGNLTGNVIGGTISGTSGTFSGNLTAPNVLYGSNSSGTQEGTVNDWDAPTKTGFYSSDNASNRWTGQANWSSILHFKLYDDNNLYSSQIGFNTYNDGLWTRTNNNGTWTSWYKIWTDNVHPTTLAGYGITDGVTINTAQTITGVKTFSNSIIGNLTGDVTGDVTGNLTGNVTGLASLNTPLNDIRSLGVEAFTNGTDPNITTAEVMAEIEFDGGFDSYSSVFKTSWSYAGNYNLTDAGRFTETAGSSWITWTDNSSDTTRGNITALAIAPTTGGSSGKVFIYNDQGGDYSPGWREVWTNTSDGAGSGLDADLLDGQQGAYYAPATGGSYVAKAGDTMTGNLKLNDDVLLEIGNGTGGDAWIYHNGTDTLFRNATGDLYIDQLADDKNISFRSDDGSGGTVEYFRVDGGDSRVIFGRSIQMADNVSIYFGNAVADDGYIKWDSTANQLFINGNAKFLEDLYVTGNQYFNGEFIEGDGKEMFRYSNTWLRINEDNDFTDGIYCGTGILRTDGQFQVGSDGNKFLVTAAGVVTALGNISAPTFNSLAINTTGVNNLVNQIVRTQANGYAMFGWINSTSGATTSTITRITASNDTYLRYVTPATFRSQIITGHYLPLSGGVVTGSSDFTASQYPLDVTGAGSVVGSTAVGLGVYAPNNTTGAIMHFHRSGAYAVNFGLDTDNILRIGGWSATSEKWYLDMNGVNMVPGSFRAPLFYDSDNTAYYGNFADITIGKYFGRAASNEGFQLGTYNNIGDNRTHSNPIYTIGSSYSPALTTLGNMYGIGYTNVAASFVSLTGGSGWGMYVAADGDARIWLDGTSGHISTAGVIYAQQYYDYANTAYYLDPASTSNINALTALGNIDTQGRFRSGGGTDSGSQLNLFSDASGYCYIAGYNLRFMTGGNNARVQRYTMDHTGIFTANASVRSPIFYDSNDTTYYLDPNSNSNLVNIGLKGRISFPSSGLATYARGSQSYAIYQESGAWTHPYPDLNIGFHTGISMGAYAGYNGMRFYNNSDMVTQVMSINNSSDGLGANQVYVNDALQAGSSLRAPIFYDSNNTTYFGDFGGTYSNITKLKISANWGTPSGVSPDDAQIQIRGTYPSMTFRSTNANKMWLRHMDSNGQIQHYYAAGTDSTSWSIKHTMQIDGTFSSSASHRAPIFYDSNNTAYYGNFASTSVMNQINAGSGNNPAFVCAANSSYGAGTELYIGGWNAGTTVSRVRNSNGNLHIDSKQGHELYLQSYPTGNVRVGNGGGYLLAYNSMRSPIFYDSNNTTYLADLSNTSTSINAAGTGIFGGDVVAYSDKKLKTNIKTLDGSKVLKMRGVSFDRIDTGNASSGVIAQEIQEIAPELVNDKNGTLAVAYGNLTGYLIEAIKNQQIVIEDLKKRLETLENN